VSDVRDGIPRASRPFESPVALAVRNSRAPVAPDPALVAAGADEAEADPAQRVAADPSVIDAERHPLYRDVVAAEHVRQSRLSRWQEQR
jgi:hypothetical protein